MRWRGKAHSMFERQREMSMFPCLTFRLRETTTACLQPEAQEKSDALRCIDAFDVRAEFTQFLVEPLVAAVNMINAAHFGNSLRL